MGFFAWILKNGVGVGLGIVFLPLLARTMLPALQQLTWPPPFWWALLAGFVLASVVHLWRRPGYFLHTYIHENAHALMCILLRVPIRGFTATDGQGGAVEHRRVDPLRTVLILIAPYIVPAFLAPALALRQLAPLVWPPAGSGWYLLALQAVVGFAAAWQMWDLARNVRHNFFGAESDLQRIGQILALVLITLAWMAILWWGAIAVSAPALAGVAATS